MFLGAHLMTMFLSRRSVVSRLKVDAKFSNNIRRLAEQCRYLLAIPHNNGITLQVNMNYPEI